MWHHSKQKSN